MKIFERLIVLEWLKSKRITKKSLNQKTIMPICNMLRQSYLQMNIIIVTSPQQMATSDDQLVLTHTKKLGNAEFDIFCKSQPGISHYIFSIEKYLRNSHPFYYNSLLAYNKGRPLEIIEKNLKLEYQKLLAERDTFQVIQKALVSREKCIEKIKSQLLKVQRVLTMFKKSYLRSNNITHSVYMEYVEQAGYSNVEIDDSIENSINIISSVFIDMSRLRDMTIYVVETIHKWKVELEEWMDQCNQYSPVLFVHNGQNAYFTILEDIKFIWESALSQHIYIDTENDPFMIRNVMQVEERPHKTIMEKYFVELLYPKSEEIVSKAVKCHDMLMFKHQPKVRSLYHEEELLIENYLSLKKKQEEEEGMEEISQKQFEWQDKVKKEKESRMSANGWVFGKVLKKPSNEKVKDMVQRHNQQKMTFIRPFNITNYTQKDSLALAFQAKGGELPITKGELTGAREELSKSRANAEIRSEFPLKKGESSLMRSSSIFQNKKQKDIQKLYRSRSTKTIREGALKKIMPQAAGKKKGYLSEEDPANQSRLDRMYRSLSKLGPVIMEDPREHNQETPKHKTHSLTKTLINQKLLLQNYKPTPHPTKLINSTKLTNSFNTTKTKAFSNSKLNTFGTSNEDSLNKSIEQISQLINQKPPKKANPQQSSLKEISIIKKNEELNQSSLKGNSNEDDNGLMKKVEQEKETNQERKHKLESNQSKLATLRELIDTHAKAARLTPLLSNRNTAITQQSKLSQSQRDQSSLSLPKRQPIPKPTHKSPYTSKMHLSPGKKPAKKQQASILKQKSFSKSKIAPSQLDFNEYKPVEPKDPTTENLKQPFKFIDDFIILTSKSIPVDIVPQYLKYLFNQLHSTSKKFTLYSFDSLLKKLQDPYAQCIIFEVSTEKRGLIGQVILSETLGISNRKLRYTVEFINIHMFELVVGAVLRIAEELLYATPCEQVICPLIEDRLDPVSTHFVELIENAFKAKVQLFGELSILQKKQIDTEKIELHERLYIFSSSKKQQQINMARIMMGNYRSLRLECKILMLSSNFRMRSKNIQKSLVANYQSESLGFLYRKVLEQIITKYHLKQMKVVSGQSGEMNEAALLLKQSSFLRTSMTALAEYLRQETITEDDFIYMTRFTSMGEVLRYLDYKEYSKYFQFEFLEESRFILHHEMFLTEIELDLSLEFMVRQSVDFLILFNHHNFMVKVIEPNLVSQAKAVILPTTQEDIELILIDGKEYEEETTSKLDLFSYLYIYQQNNLKNYKEQHNLKEVVIPMIQNSNRSINPVKMFDGLFRLFPEREFYSGTYFNCTNLWESYFPSAVVYQPAADSVIFEYPLIVGFMHKTRKEILTAFVLKTPPVQ